MQEASRPTAIVFGASGTIGAAVARWFAERGWRVIGVSRSGGACAHASESLAWDVGDAGAAFDGLRQNEAEAIVWAQGMNLSDDIGSYDRARHREVYDANVVYILDSLQALRARGLVGPGARLCVISSIWQDIARQQKLSYCVSKSALEGLVRSLSVDLGPEGILVNAVLPGPLDTPMTHRNLSPAQLTAIVEATPLRSLPTLDDVCGLVGFLCSNANTGITGQFVAADRGYSYVRIV